METATYSGPTSKTMLWTSYVLSALPVLVLAFSATMKFLKPPEVVKGLSDFGWPESLLLLLGILEVASTVAYLIPQTAVLGAVLLTGYFGGAIATHLRVGEQQGFAPACMPLILGVFLWLGLYLRDARLRALLPLRS